MFYSEIAIDVPLPTLFTYKSSTPLASGARVLVSFGRKKMVGIAVSSSTAMPDLPEETLKKLKTVTEVLDEKPFLPEEYLDWLLQASEHYCGNPGQVIASALPEWVLHPDAKKRDKERKARVIKIPKWKTTPNIVLTEEQNQVIATLERQAQKFYPALLHGVTGSGKTEIYIEFIKYILSLGKSVLYLVPEIGLTPQTLGRLNAHFQDQLLITHSGLTENQRHLQWMACKETQPKVLVGTRSALFAPFQNLGAIIIDEEHDSSYKQEERFRYHARDLALVRAKNLNIPVVLGSATPSLESYHLAQQGKYHYFRLQNRVGVSHLPQIEVLDVGKEKNQTGSVLHLSQHIHRKIEQYVKAKEQVILFVGQRGFAQNAYCVACEDVEMCPNCSVGLKFHARQNQIKCHYCDYEKSFDEICGKCGDKALTLIGVGIQAIETELQEMHPGLRFERVDSDRFPSPQKLEEVFVRFQNHELDLIVGTQMMTKGHDFAKVGFVGVAGIEAQLGLPDFRANERSFQTLVQVAGRAGRQKKRGLVLVQSYTPGHMSLRYGVEQDFEGFAKEELQKRKELFYPPFSRLVQIKIIANHEDRLRDFLKTRSQSFASLRQSLRKQNIFLVGPTEMPIFKLRGWFRHHLILKIPRHVKANQVAKFVVESLKVKEQRGIELQVDVDPLSLF